MKFAIIGQQDFGKAVMEAFLARGDRAVAVFCAPEKEGARPDALRLAAQQRSLKVHQFKSLRDPEAARAMQEAGADIGIMAFVTQFAPQDFCSPIGVSAAAWRLASASTAPPSKSSPNAGILKLPSKTSLRPPTSVREHFLIISLLRNTCWPLTVSNVLPQLKSP